MAPLGSGDGGGGGGGAAVSGPVTTGSGGTMAHPDTTTASKSEKTIQKRLNIGQLNLRETREHLVSGLHRLAVHFVGALRGDHVDEFFGDVHVGRFHILLQH